MINPSTSNVVSDVSETSFTIISPVGVSYSNEESKVKLSYPHTTSLVNSYGENFT